MDPGLIAFCLEAVAPHKVLDSHGAPAPRHLRVSDLDSRKVVAQSILTAAEDGSALSPEAIAQRILDRCSSATQAGAKLVVELMADGTSNPRDRYHLVPRGQLVATKSPLEVLQMTVGGKTESLILADPTAQLGAALVALALGTQQRDGILMESDRSDVRYWAQRSAQAEASVAALQVELRWTRATEILPEPRDDGAGDPAWTALLRTIEALRGPLDQIVGAGAAVIRAQYGGGSSSSPAPTSSAEPAADLDPGDDAIPYEEIPDAVDRLSEALVALLRARPDLILGALPKLLPVIHAGGPAVAAALRAALADPAEIVPDGAS